jgi:hypothetical protein
MMELKGRFNGKMIKRAKFGDMYFDEMGGFESVERDRVTGTVSLTFFPIPFLLCLVPLLIFFMEPSAKKDTGRSQESAHLEADQGRAGAAHAACVGEVTR